MNILIVKLSAVGDVVHTLPALNALRRHYPRARITWLVEEAASGIVQGHRALDRVIISRRKKWVKGFRKGSWLGQFREISRFIRKLRDTRYDLIIDFQALLKSAVLIRLARGRRKIGFDRGMEHMEYSYLFLNERIAPVDMNIHALCRGMLLLKAIGVEPGDIEYHLPVSDTDRSKLNASLAARGIDPAGRLIAINPVAKWDTKLWSGQKFAALADRIGERSTAALVFTGSRGDRKTIENIISRMQCDAVNLAGETSLNMLAAVYEKAEFVVSTDTGPAHIAAATGTPVVALFGPTAPWRTGPFGPAHQIIRTGKECSPCFKRDCPTRECMEKITVTDVLEGIEKLDRRRL
jgi:3-deoxy-D-manno-octulosonic-acid transferase/heptosyltransferase-1